jgi:anti-anti-sigma factor
MNIPVQIQADKARISLPHSFDLHAQTDFRHAYAGVLDDPEVKELELDFTAVDYIDSSALGNLLLLRQRAENQVQSIRFTQCKPDVMSAFSMANFHRIFDIRRA